MLNLASADNNVVRSSSLHITYRLLDASDCIDLHVYVLQNARPPLPSACPHAFRHLIKRCWSKNPEKRPHFDEIVSILETYLESYTEDPEFFCHYMPSSRHIVLQCLPNCITKQMSASLKPRNSSSS